ncbi:MAG: Uma2 family endonuclease [Leptolyngbya sp. SIO1D8]|nr:Uma2 family endonuclease [Leptolyngbya sp. SIO1D8]
MAVTIARWTLSDYHAMIAAGLLKDQQIELLNGLVVEMAPEGPEHADCSTLLMPQLWRMANGRYQVRVGKPISIPSSDSEPEPDIALVRDQSYRKGHPTPKDVFLVIEFSQSSLAKDTEDKRLVYAQAGIEDYWVINLRDRCAIVYRKPSNGDYQSEQKVFSGDLSPLAFPDVMIDVNRLLES